MILGERSQLENHIIATLASNGPSTVAILHSRLNTDDAVCSIQGVYRVLRQLITDGIVIKNKSVVSIALPWLLDLSSLVQSMQDTFLHPSSLSQLLPKQGAKKRIWTFTNLFTMNTFWSHLLVTIAKHAQAPYSVHYSPHTWYRLLHKQHSFQCTKTMLQEMENTYTVVGSRSYLDDYAVSEVTDRFEHAHQYLARASEYIDKDRALHIDVIGDYVFFVKLDEKTHASLEDLYAKTTTIDDINIPDIIDIYSQNTKIRVLLKKDPHKARVYRKKFEQIFGPLEQKKSTPK
jgi:DNA-binding Lrp family transcriptional regulator